jgi:hypothetical protein
MEEATTETVATISVQDRLTDPFTVHFPRPASGGFTFGEQEYWTTFLH